MVWTFCYYTYLPHTNYHRLSCGHYILHQKGSGPFILPESRPESTTSSRGNTTSVLGSLTFILPRLPHLKPSFLRLGGINDGKGVSHYGLVREMGTSSTDRRFKMHKDKFKIYLQIFIIEGVWESKSTLVHPSYCMVRQWGLELRCLWFVFYKQTIIFALLWSYENRYILQNQFGL